MRKNSVATSMRGQKRSRKLSRIKAHRAKRAELAQSDAAFLQGLSAKGVVLDPAYAAKKWPKVKPEEVAEEVNA